MLGAATGLEVFHQVSHLQNYAAKNHVACCELTAQGLGELRHFFLPSCRFFSSIQPTLPWQTSPSSYSLPKHNPWDQQNSSFAIDCADSMHVLKSKLPPISGREREHGGCLHVAFNSDHNGPRLEPFFWRSSTLWGGSFLKLTKLNSSLCLVHWDSISLSIVAWASKVRIDLVVGSGTLLAKTSNLSWLCRHH